MFVACLLDDLESRALLFRERPLHGGGLDDSAAGGRGFVIGRQRGQNARGTPIDLGNGVVGSLLGALRGGDAVEVQSQPFLIRVQPCDLLVVVGAEDLEDYVVGMYGLAEPLEVR